MSLLIAGYWPTTYWPSRYWPDDYWPEYGLTTPLDPFDTADANSINFSAVPESFSFQADPFSINFSAVVKS